MRRKSRLVTLHPAAPPLERRALGDVLNQALRSADEASPLLAPHLAERGFAHFIEQVSGGKFPNWEGRRLPGRGSFCAMAGMHLGLALSGSAPLSYYRTAHNAFAQVARSFAHPVPRTRKAGRPGLIQTQDYLALCFERGLRWGHMLGQNVSALARKAGANSIAQLVSSAAMEEVICWFDRKSVKPGDAKHMVTELESYLVREYLCAFALGYFDITPSEYDPRGRIPSRTQLLTQFSKQPGLEQAITEAALDQADQESSKLLAYLKRAHRRYLLPTAFLSKAVRHGQEVKAGAEES